MKPFNCMFEWYWLISKLFHFCPFVRIKASGLGQSGLFFSLLFGISFGLVRKQPRTCLVASLPGSVSTVVPSRKSRCAFRLAPLSQRNGVKFVEKPRVAILSTEKKKVAHHS